MMYAFLAAAAAVAAATPAAAERAVPPTNGRFVVDQANVLTPAQEDALLARVRAVNAVAGHQLAVLTVPSLQGTDVVDYGNRVLRAWKLGARSGPSKDDGVLLLLAVAERKSRIEVGYGLTPVLTDAQSNIINREKIVPEYKRGDYNAGLAAGVEAIGSVINAPQAAPAALAATPARQPQGSSYGLLWWLLGGLGAVLAGGGGLVYALNRADRRRLERLWEKEERLLQERVRREAVGAAESERLRQRGTASSYGKPAAPVPARKTTRSSDYTPPVIPVPAPNYTPPSRSSSNDYGSSSSSSSSDYGSSSSSSSSSWSSSDSSSSSGSYDSSSSSSSYDSGGGGSSGGGGDSSSW